MAIPGTITVARTDPRDIGLREVFVALDEALLGLRPRPQVTTAARVVAAG